MKKLSCATFVFLLSVASFADDVDSLRDAIANNKNIEVTDLLEKGVDPNEVKYFGSSPSFEISKSLLASRVNPLNPNKFLRLVLDAPSHEERKIELVELALGHGADPNEMEYFCSLPSPETSSLLLENGKNQEKKLDPSKFLRLIIKASSSGSGEKLLELVKLALEKYKADPNTIDRFGSFPSPEVIRLLLDSKKDTSYANKVLNMISLVVPSCMCSRDMNGEWEKPNDEEVTKLVNIRTELIKLTLQYGASAQSIDGFFILP